MTFRVSIHDASLPTSSARRPSPSPGRLGLPTTMAKRKAFPRMKSSGDVEKAEKPVPAVTVTPSSPTFNQSTSPTSSASAAPISDDLERVSGFTARLRVYESMLDRKLGVEMVYPSRILDEKRVAPRSWAILAMWASGTMNLACFATGLLGWGVGLDLQNSILVVVFGSLLGSLVTGWCATFGPATGLRQTSIARYSFGWWPSKIVSTLNVVSQLGWSAISCLTGGLALSALANGHITLVQGIALISIFGLILSIVGLRGALKYEEFSCVIFLVVILVMYGEVAKFADLKTVTLLTPKNQSLPAGVLSFLSVVYGYSVSWSTIVADYYVSYPPSTSKFKIVALTSLGITIPTSFVMILGCCVGSTMANNDIWYTAYRMNGIGDLIQTMLYPRGLAKFILFIFAVSGVTTNAISLYSASLSLHHSSRVLARYPRMLWTFPIFITTILLALAGRAHLVSTLQNFVSLLGYWNTIFFAILLTEHYVFRRGKMSNYDLNAWNDEEKLPVGYAGIAAFLMGLVGTVLGWWQWVLPWFVGPIAKKLGNVGVDLGSELAFLFTVLTYVVVRWWEKRLDGI